MTLPQELLLRIEKAMNEIDYGTATVSWAAKGDFIELQILEKVRVEKPEDYHRG